MGGITYQKFININFSGTGKGFPVDESKTNNMSLGGCRIVFNGQLEKQQQAAVIYWPCKL